MEHPLGPHPRDLVNARVALTGRLGIRLRVEDDPNLDVQILTISSRKGCPGTAQALRMIEHELAALRGDCVKSEIDKLAEMFGRKDDA